MNIPAEIITNSGKPLCQLTNEKPVLLVFLRHFGCTFCRETMAYLSNHRNQIEASGVDIVIIHMAKSVMAEEMFRLYDLHNVNHISDEHQLFYKYFGLCKTNIKSLYGVKNWWRALVAGLVKGHYIGKPVGDPYQMPGVFLFHKNKIMHKFTYRYVSDRPNFLEMVSAA